MTNFDQMNNWNLYFFAYFMENIQKLYMRGARSSNITVKFIASPFMYVYVVGTWATKSDIVRGYKLLSRIF